MPDFLFPSSAAATQVSPTPPGLGGGGLVMSPACLLEGGGETQHLVTRHSVNPTPRRACGYQECQTYCACAMCFPWTSGSQATAMSRSLVPRPTSVSLCVRSFSMSPSLTVPAGSVKGWVVGGLSETYLMLSYFLLSAFWLPSDWPSTFA